MLNEKRIAQQLIKRYGPVIDLKAHPEVMIEIIRYVGSLYASEPGTPDGGTGPSGPTSRQGSVTNEDIMKELLKLSRSVSALGKTPGKTTPTRSASAERTSR